MMMILIRSCLWVLAAIAFLASAILSPSALVPREAPPSADDSYAGKTLARRMVELARGEGDRLFWATADELDGLGRLTGHGLGWVRPRVMVGKGLLWVDATFDVAPGQHVNLQAVLQENRTGFPPIQARLGALPIPAILSRPLVSGLLTALGFGHEANNLDQLVRFVNLPDGRSAFAGLSMPEGLLERLRGVFPETGAKIDPERVQFYYAHLMEQDLLQGLGPHPLATMVNQAFGLAATNSAGRDPTQEAKAAFVALGIMAVGPRVRLLAGGDLAILNRCRLEAVPMLLAGRPDLAKHFTLSAALGSVFADRLSRAAGEWKELNDSLPGGSGFSFVDLVADRAGLRVALATDDPAAVQRMIAQLAHVSDAQLLPPETTLTYKEGLSASQFKGQYGSIEEARYRAMIASIDGYLERLRLYQGIPRPTVG